MAHKEQTAGQGRGCQTDTVEAAVQRERTRCAEVAYIAASMAEGYEREDLANLARTIGREIMRGT